MSTAPSFNSSHTVILRTIIKLLVPDSLRNHETHSEPFLEHLPQTEFSQFMNGNCQAHASFGLAVRFAGQKCLEMKKM